MKFSRFNSFNFIFFLLLICVAACKNQPNGAAPNTDTSEEANTVHNTHPAFGEVDPDPTDTIAAGNYLINAANVETAEKVRATLRDSLLKDDLVVMDSSQRKFMIHDIDLNSDGLPETFVAFAGAKSCGSTGCMLFLLNDDATLNSIITVSQFPVVVLNSQTRNWKDLLINYNAVQYSVKYDGIAFPTSIDKLQPYTQNVSPDLPRIFDFQHAAYPWFRF